MRQECITNACRHSKSKKVKVELTQHDDRLRVEVRDWGVGFKVDSS
ncbi:MAG: ATP-binding protein [Thermoguttaceae bacterium]